MDEPLNSSEEWAIEIVLDRLKAELDELLREHNAAEVAELMNSRYAHHRSIPSDAQGEVAQ